MKKKYLYILLLGTGLISFILSGCLGLKVPEGYKQSEILNNYYENIFDHAVKRGDFFSIVKKASLDQLERKISEAFVFINYPNLVYSNISRKLYVYAKKDSLTPVFNGNLASPCRIILVCKPLVDNETQILLVGVSEDKITKREVEKDIYNFLEILRRF